MDVVDRWWMGVGGLMVDRVGAEDKRAGLTNLVYKNAWWSGNCEIYISVIALVSSSG